MAAGIRGGSARAPALLRLPAAAGSAALFSLALAVTFPAAIPGGPAGLRTTELVGVAATGFSVLALLSGAALHRAAVPIAIAACLSIPWVWAEVISISVLTPDNPARFALVRWVMAFATGYWLAVLMDDDRSRRATGVGLLCGLLLSLGTVCHDALTFDPSQVTLLTLKDEEVMANRWVGGVYRAAGIFGHPNNAAAVALLIVPLVIGLVEERRLPTAALLIAVSAIGATFAATQTRGPVAVAAVLLLWHLVRGSLARKIVAVVSLALVLASAAVLEISVLGGGGSPLLERFSDQGAAAENLGGRVLTTLASLQLALEYPLGLGSSYRHLLEARTGWDSTHNAYLQLALMGGVPLALFVSVRLFACAMRSASPRRATESWVAAYVVGAFLFENLFFAPTFTLFAVWLLWRPLGAAAMADSAARNGGVSGAWPTRWGTGGGASGEAPGVRPARGGAISFKHTAQMRDSAVPEDFHRCSKDGLL